MVELLKREEVFRELVTEFTNLFKIMLTLPEFTCTAESSFSDLRRLKTYLRSRMKQQRLNSVAIMNVHKNHRRSQGGPKGPWPPLNYKTVSKKIKS